MVAQAQFTSEASVNAGHIGFHITRVTPKQSDQHGARQLSPALAKLFREGDIALPIDFPGRNIAELEILEYILSEGRVTGTWNDISFAVPATNGGSIVHKFAGDKFYGLGLIGPSITLRVGSAFVELGPEWLLSYQARLANSNEAHAQAYAGLRDDSSIPLRFLPGRNTTIDIFYPEPPRVVHSEQISEEVRRAAITARGYLTSRPGPFNIRMIGPLRTPIEIAPDPRPDPQGWRLEVPDSVQATLSQLDFDEQDAILQQLWMLQRPPRQEMALTVRELTAGDEQLFVLRPTSGLRVLLRPISKQRARVAEIVRSDTLRNMFNGR